MIFITAQNTLNTFLTFKHLFLVQGVRFPCQESRRKFHDVKLVKTSLRRTILRREIDSHFSSVTMIINQITQACNYKNFMDFH